LFSELFTDLLNLVGFGLSARVLKVDEIAILFAENVMAAALSGPITETKEQVAKILISDVRVGLAAHHLFEDLFPVSH
jgi:hypothetical protein